MGGFSVDCGFNGVRSGFGQSILEGEAIYSWEFCGEPDVWIYGVEVLLKIFDLSVNTSHLLGLCIQ